MITSNTNIFPNMDEKTMDTHMCMFIGSELCLCRISRCLCCVIRKKLSQTKHTSHRPYCMYWVSGKAVAEKEIPAGVWHLFCHDWPLIFYFQPVLQRADQGSDIQDWEDSKRNRTRREEVGFGSGRGRQASRRVAHLSETGAHLQSELNGKGDWGAAEAFVAFALCSLLRVCGSITSL